MKRLTYIFILMIGLFSCTDSTVGGPPRLEVYIEDSPGDFGSVTIALESVEVFAGEVWKTIASNNQSIVITSLTGGKSQLIAVSEMDELSISKLRLTFATAGNRLTSDASHPLTIADVDRVIEMPFSMDLGDGGNYVMFDMDVYKSVDTTNFVLKPKVTVVDMDNVGAVSGVIATEKGIKIAEMMLVQIYNGSGNVKNTYTNKSSGLFFARVPDGDYTITISPKETSTYQSVEIGNVIVSNKSVTGVGVNGVVQLTKKPIL